MPRLPVHAAWLLAAIWLASTPLPAAAVPDSFFGIRFGDPLPEHLVVQPKDPRYEALVEAVPPEDRRMLEGEALEALIPDLDAIPQRHHADLREEFAGVRFAALVAPPEPASLFDAYMVVLTPESHRIVAVWAHGARDTCFDNVRRITEYLLDRHQELELSGVSEDFRTRASNEVWLASGEVEISVHCAGVDSHHRGVEAQWEAEMQSLSLRAAERLLELRRQ
jgi:hypothetical protein